MVRATKCDTVKQVEFPSRRSYRGAAAIVKQNKRASFFPKGKNAPNDIFAEYVHDDKFEKE